MQLVYLYIENYKNIEKQGFNFSLEFNCKFENSILTIDKNNECKNSIFEVILKIIEDEINENYILVYNDKGLYYISNFEKKKILSLQRIYLYILTIWTINIMLRQ
jgi:hypothetical protein